MSSQSGTSEFGQGSKERMNEGMAATQERVMGGADKGMDRAAEGLESAAEKMRSRAGEEDGMRSSVQVKAADAMDKTATYLKEHDSEELLHELEDYVKAHPLQAAAGALVAGFVLAKIVR
jgi:hypothetical protein